MRTYWKSPRAPSRAGALGLLLLLPAACGADGTRGGAPAEQPEEGCRILHRSFPLPDGLAEASGAAWSHSQPGAFWSHNDSGNRPQLFLVRADGTGGSRLPVRGARMADWEDIAVGPCPEGRCVYIGDIGDGDRRPAEPLTLYVLPEPGPGATEAGPARSYRARFPDRRTRDTEAMFVLPDGSLYLITKGNREPVELYRWPTPLREDSTVRLERVRQLAPRPTQTGDRVTGASASADGRHVAVRTYGTLSLYRTADLLEGRPAALRMDLMPLGEAQGEGVALGDDGTVVLVTESGSRHLPGTGALLRCPLPEEAAPPAESAP